MKRVPFVALAVAAVLLVLWSVFGGGGDPEPTDPVTGSAARAAGTESGQPLQAAVSGEERQPGTGPSVRTEVDTPAPTGGGALRTVRGRLVDSAGRPVADLELRLATTDSGGDFVELPVPPRVGARPDAEDPGATSARDGVFSFSVADGRIGTVSLHHDEWVLAHGVDLRAPEGDVDLGDVKALRAGVVSGTVLDAAGRPVDGVRVAAGEGDSGLLDFSLRGRSVTTSDEQGRFRLTRLRPGAIWLRTASPKFLPAEQKLSLDEGEEHGGVSLRLQSGAAIAGQVLDDLGRSVAGIKVGARRKAERGNISVERFTPDEATVTDRNGLFTLAGLEGDTAQVRAWGDGYQTANESNVPVGTGNLTLRVARLGIVEGVLVAEDGGPVAGSRVRAQAARGDTGFGGLDELPLIPGAAATRTAEDGSFRLESVSPGAVTVRATGDGHRPVVQEGVIVRPGAVAGGVRLVAVRGAAVEVTVLDPEGRPVAGVAVKVVEPPRETGGNRMRMRVEEEENGEMLYHSGQEHVLGRGVTDADGKVTVAGLPPKAAQVHAEHDDYAEAQAVAVTLPAVGSVTAELALREAGTAVVRVIGPDGGAVAEARFQLQGPRVGGDPGRKWKGVTDANGETQMRSLPPGAYSAQLELQPPGRSMGGGSFVVFGDTRLLKESRVDFAVRSRESTDVQLHRPVLASVRGTVTDADGPVAGAVVELEPAVDEGPGTPGGVFSARTGVDGSYSVDDLSAGRYTVRYGRTEQVVKAEDMVEVLPGQADLEKDLVLLGGKLRITAFSEGEAEPVEGAEVILERADGPAAGQPRRQIVMMAITTDGSGAEAMRMNLGGNTTKTGADGVAEIEDVPPGRYDVRIRDADHATFTLPDQVVVDGGVTDCGTVELAPAGILRGTVKDAQGGDVRMAMVEYWPANEPGEREMRSAMNGAFRLAGLTPGRYRLRARGIPMGPGTQASDFGPEQEVEVQAGSNPAVELRTR